MVSSAPQPPPPLFHVVRLLTVGLSASQDTVQKVFSCASEFKPISYFFIVLIRGSGFVLRSLTAHLLIQALLIFEGEEHVTIPNCQKCLLFS